MSYTDEQLEQFIKAHEERVTARKTLASKNTKALTTVLIEYMRKERLSRRIFADVYDEFNYLIYNLPSREIKSRNGLAKSAPIRDYYATEVLIAYNCLTVITTNLVLHGVEPVEAARISATLGLRPEQIPQDISLVENIHKVTKVIEAKRRELAEKAELEGIRSYPNGASSFTGKAANVRVRRSCKRRSQNARLTAPKHDGRTPTQQGSLTA